MITMSNNLYFKLMAILDFDKHRRAKRQSKSARKFDVQKLLIAAGAVIALASATVWLIRDAKDVADSFGPPEGSLIVNINAASEAELVSVPGIGPTRAAQVIAGRPYKSVDDLEKIAGIAGKTLESLRPFVTVDGETRQRN
ncbi:MAG TPA: helix-hairpin-helix domain-containing protein [Woeseiaceae bacterium]|nr:helix-hairpin-helix domain-containing protein [Woeseiaceae bacterium]